MKKFAVFDIDGTLIRWQLYHGIANEFAKQGLLGEDGYSALKEARKKWKNREQTNSFKEYERIVIKRLDETITEIPSNVFDKAVDSVLEEYKLQTYDFTKKLINNLKKNGYFLLAISGSPKEIVSQIADFYGFNDYKGSTYKRRNGGFTGKKDIVAHDKKSALEKLILKNKLSIEDSVAVGDTESDIPMLEMVAHPIAFNPNKQLFKHAKKKAWKIVVERKNVIYELEQKGESYLLA